jgi:DNA-directed RNA polymerase subunit H (RpoH/RPB5)
MFQFPNKIVSEEHALVSEEHSFVPEENILVLEEKKTTLAIVNVFI